MRLAAGVRRVARVQLKERLAARLSVPRTSAVPWPRIAAVAAAIVIVAGVSVIALWLQLREPGVNSAAPPTGSGSPYATEAKKDRSEAPATPPPAKGEPSTDIASTERNKAPVPGGKELAKSEEARGNLPGDVRAPDALKESEKALQAAAPVADAARAVGNEELWTEGVVSEEPVTATGAVRRDEADRARPADSEMQTKISRKMAAKPIALDQQVILTQQPSRLLRGQEQARQQGKRKAIPTLARQVGDQLHLTLYPDTLFPAADLEQATIQRPGNDSLLIQVGSRLIRYRLPSSLLQQKTAR